MAETTTKRVIPKFATEAEEAEWWDKNRDMVSRDFREAGLKGEVKKLTLERLRERLANKSRPDHDSSRISGPQTCAKAGPAERPTVPDVHPVSLT